MTAFRVHLSDGTKVDVDAGTPDAAKKAAIGPRKDVVTVKIKRVKKGNKA